MESIGVTLNTEIYYNNSLDTSHRTGLPWCTNIDKPDFCRKVLVVSRAGDIEEVNCCKRKEKSCKVKKL